jgi:hypothetical protein
MELAEVVGSRGVTGGRMVSVEVDMMSCWKVYLEDIVFSIGVLKFEFSVCIFQNGRYS